MIELLNETYTTEQGLTWCDHVQSINGQMNTWIEEQIDTWMDGWMDGWIDN